MPNSVYRKAAGRPTPFAVGCAPPFPPLPFSSPWPRNPFSPLLFFSPWLREPFQPLLFFSPWPREPFPRRRRVMLVKRYFPTGRIGPPLPQTKR